MRTCPGPGSGMFLSTTRSSPPGVAIWAAFIVAVSILGCSVVAMKFSSSLHLNLENQLELDRDTQREARHSVDHAARIPRLPEDILQQVRCSVGYPGLVSNISHGCHQHSETHHPLYAVERAEGLAS